MKIKLLKNFSGFDIKEGDIVEAEPSILWGAPIYKFTDKNGTKTGVSIENAEVVKEQENEL